ncbi:MAG: hypothetical protein J2P36_11195, partial [Ktedonobacteraceae bacterium]|nr:hypothetical protein [Ktedonobacteraceae bacterium]
LCCTYLSYQINVVSGAQFSRLFLLSLRIPWVFLSGVRKFLFLLRHSSLRSPWVMDKPREQAVFTSPHMETDYRHVVPEGVQWQDRISARAILHLPLYHPITYAPRVQCPLLLYVGDCTQLTSLTLHSRPLKLRHTVKFGDTIATTTTFTRGDLSASRGQSEYLPRAASFRIRSRITGDLIQQSNDGMLFR